MRTFFDIVVKANLTVNLANIDFCHATIQYLGHKAVQGCITISMAKVETIPMFPISAIKKESMPF